MARPKKITKDITPPKVQEFLQDEVKRTSQAEAARAIGITQSCVSKFLKGDSEPTAATLQKLADYFGVTVAYLRGEERVISDGKPPFQFVHYLRVAVKKSGAEAVAEETGILLDDVKYYCLGIGYPSDDDFARLAKYTGKELSMFGKNRGEIAFPVDLEILLSGEDVYSFLEQIFDYSFSWMEVALNIEIGKVDQRFMQMVLGLAKIITSNPIGLYLETLESDRLLELLELDDKARKVLEKYKGMPEKKKTDFPP